MYIRTLYLVCFGYRRAVDEGVRFREWGFIHPPDYYRATAAATRAAFVDRTSNDGGCQSDPGQHKGSRDLLTGPAQDRQQQGDATPIHVAAAPSLPSAQWASLAGRWGNTRRDARAGLSGMGWYNDPWVNGLPPLVECPDHVCVDHSCDCQRDRVGQAEGSVAGANRSRIVRNRDRDRNGLAAIDEITGGGEPRTSCRGRADEDLRT